MSHGPSRPVTASQASLSTDAPAGESQINERGPARPRAAGAGRAYPQKEERSPCVILLPLCACPFPDMPWGGQRLRREGASESEGSSSPRPLSRVKRAPGGRWRAEPFAGRGAARLKEPAPRSRRVGGRRTGHQEPRLLPSKARNLVCLSPGPGKMPA